MKPLKVVIPLFAWLGIVQPATADIYRCKQPDGKTLYQQTPCAEGEQKAIDDRQARQLRDEQERKRKQAVPPPSR